MGAAAFALTPILGGTFWALATEGRRNHPKWGVFRSVQYAHRGLHNRELGIPENSMAAFRKARELGYGVELDVHLTKDGQLAVIHDKSLKRTTGVDAEVSDLTMEELKRCRWKAPRRPSRPWRSGPAVPGAAPLCWWS